MITCSGRGVVITEKERTCKSSFDDNCLLTYVLQVVVINLYNKRIYVRMVSAARAPPLLIMLPSLRGRIKYCTLSVCPSVRPAPLIDSKSESRRH